jgi:hypothetical protein
MRLNQERRTKHKEPRPYPFLSMRLNQERRTKHKEPAIHPLLNALTLADALLATDGGKIIQPRELPGRYGRVIRDLERLFVATDVHAVVAGGWAVWLHGYVGRVTQDVDIVIPAVSQEAVLQVAPMFGFDVLPVREGVWPKLTHRETDIDVDLMPEAGIPGTPTRPGPVPIRHPSVYGAKAGELSFIELSGLFELKLGSHRARDVADLVELIKVNPSQLDEIGQQLKQVHPDFSEELRHLIRQADEESG